MLQDCRVSEEAYGRDSDEERRRVSVSGCGRVAVQWAQHLDQVACMGGREGKGSRMIDDVLFIICFGVFDSVCTYIALRSPVFKQKVFIQPHRNNHRLIKTRTASLQLSSHW